MAKYWFDHVHLVSPDPARTAEFYESSIGAERVRLDRLPDGRTGVVLSLKGGFIKITGPRDEALVPNTLPNGCGLEHFGIQTDNLEEAVAELKAKGVRFVQEISSVVPTSKIAFFVSPEGILIELLEIKG